MTDPNYNPQNPYISCVVRASAGCGKTYQLSHRFLYLVAAGACPTSILTITFTKKAASEMRERILEESANLLKDQKAQKHFQLQMENFFQQQQSKHPMFKPLSAIETAKKILSTTQGLKINTIDSIFLEWVKKFPFESQGDRPNPLPSKMTIASESKSRALTQEAWEQVCVDLFGDHPRRPSILSPDELQKRILELQKHQSFIWLCLQKSGSTFKGIKTKGQTYSSLSQLIKALKEDFLSIVDQVNPKKREQLVTAILKGDEDRLINLRLLTKDLRVSGSTLRGKKRDLLTKEIEAIEEALGQFRDQQRIQQLNEVGDILTRLFNAFGRYRDAIKDRHALLEFDDSTKGCYQLFTAPDNIGARFLIHQQVKHLLLDEFQDTSSLQWAIFQSIAQELLAGQGLIDQNSCKSTLFIVGDEKQSIYGFREADSRILMSAAQQLQAFGVKDIPLNHSYRTSQIILDFVNQSFSTLITDFPLHQTANVGGEAAVPNMGSVAISPLFQEDDGVEQEAAFVASYIDSLLQQGWPVFDKQFGGLRPLEPKDCAILYRSSTHIPVFETALRERGLEYRREENRGFFNRQEVRDIIHLLNFLCFPSHLTAFAAFMSSCMSPIPKTRLLSCLDRHRGHQLPSQVVEACLKDLAQDFPKFVGQCRTLMDRSPFLSPSHLLVEIYQSLAPVSRYQDSFLGAEGAYAEANLQQLLNFVLDQEGEGHQSLQTLLQTLEEFAREDLMGSSSPTENAVRLMTIHKSKGLEFPFVTIVGLGEAWEKRDPYWVKQTQTATPGISYVGTGEDRPIDDQGFNEVYQQVLDDDKLENTRLLYVASTRAKHHLLLSGSRKAASRKEQGFYSHLYETLLGLGATEAALDESSYHHLKENITPLTESSEAPTNYRDEPVTYHPPYHKLDLELKTLAPNKLLSRGDFQTSNMGSSPFHPFAREAGTLIHQILEHKAHNRPFQVREAWLALFSGGDKQRFLQVGELAACQGAEVYHSKTWTRLLEQAQEIHTEMDLVHIDGRKLIRGSIDLLLRTGKNQWLVVDYKTSPIKDIRHLAEFIEEQGYQRQILAYVKAVKDLYQDSQVNGGLYFTECNQLIITHQDGTSTEDNVLQL